MIDMKRDGVEAVHIPSWTADSGASETIVHRPWGGYRVLEETATHKVKRIWVQAGEVLSLQSHEHRDEHWVVVKGAAQVTLGSEIHHLDTNDAVFIPRRTMHRIANPGPGTMEFVEVQTGSYFGEDDIVRYEDKYGRLGKVS